MPTAMWVLRKRLRTGVLSASLTGQSATLFYVTAISHLATRSSASCLGGPEAVGVLEHLSAVHPFIELPDLVVDNPAALDADVIKAVNVGARRGVLGAAVPVAQSDAFLASLAGMQVVVTDQDGQKLASAPGAAIRGHPLNAVLWLRDSGVVFAEGDLVSLASFGPLLATAPGVTATVAYEGFAGDPQVGVTRRHLVHGREGCPERLVADTAYGSAETLACLVREQGIESHIPVICTTSSPFP